MYGKKKASKKGGKGVGGSAGKDQFNISSLEKSTNAKKNGSQPSKGRSVV